MPLLAWRDVDPVTLARWAEATEAFPGVDVYVQPERSYPQGKLAAHATATSSVTGPAAAGRDRPFLPAGNDRTAWVERQYNDVLTGVSGGQLIQVDARRALRGAGGRTGGGGRPHLTLDVNIQRTLEKALRGWRGAGVGRAPA